MNKLGNAVKANVWRNISLALIAALMLPACGCSEQPVTTERLNYRWIDSNLFENIDLMYEYDLKDDFAAAVNRDWASQQTKDFSMRISAFGEVEQTVVQNKRALLEDESFQNKNVELLRIADGLFCDWEYRDSCGVDPLKKYLDYIDEIETIDDVSAYMLDNEKNPLAVALVELECCKYLSSDGYFALMVSEPEPTLEESEYYVNITEEGYVKKEEIEYQVKYLLGRCGYSDKEIEDTINGCFSFESKMISADRFGSDDYITMISREEILAKAGNYPLEDMLNHYSITECNLFCGGFEYVDNLENIYVQKNVEEMKAYFKVRLALEAIKYLDAGSYDCFRDSKVDRSNPFAERTERDPDWSFFYVIKESSLTAAMDQAYIDYYYDEETYNDVVNMIHEIKDQYRILISSNTNLSEEGKASVLEKLDKMGEHVIRPSNTADFTGVELKSKEEGGTYLDALCVINRVKYEHVGDVVQMQTEKAFWDIYDGEMSTTVSGSFYYNSHNTIYIQIGILEDPLYSPDAPFEERLASFGTILGHEISHAFDSGNIHYDANGAWNTKISSDDLTTWNNMETRIKNHLSTYEPFDGSGKYDMTTNAPHEVIADVEGVRVCLMIAAEYDSFDYDKFFRSYAAHWRSMNLKTDQMDDIRNDEHPLLYLRINYTLIQFDEFDKTYGIEPGDGMYLAPDQRVFVW